VLLAETEPRLLYTPQRATWAVSSNNSLTAAAPKLPSSLVQGAHDEVKKDRLILCSKSHSPGKKILVAEAQSPQLLV
jgi:hypothetical protein